MRSRGVAVVALVLAASGLELAARASAGRSIFVGEWGCSDTAAGGDVITANWVDGNAEGPGIALDAATDTAVTGNTVAQSCGAGIQVTGGFH